MVMNALDKIFPKIKGDYVTFIGSTFVSYGQRNILSKSLYLSK